jgi:signal peptide peptidase SppA
MKYPRILSALRSAKWAATPATIQAVADALGAHLRGAALVPDRMPGTVEEPQKAAGDNVAGGVAVIPVYGVIGRHLSSMETECGGCDVETVGAALDAAIASASVSAIVFDIDSPGGVVAGVPELAAKICEANAIKPCFAFTGGQCCSAAYWIASGCTGIFATKSADLGSIGVYVALCDDSEWWTKQGYKLELIKAGEFKAMGISGKPLSDKERAMIQSDVDAIYAMFTGDVRASRDGVQNEAMQGQTFMGEAAVAANLADEIVPSLDALVLTIAQQLKPSPVNNA